MRTLMIIAAAGLSLAACADRDRPVAGLCKAFPDAAPADGAAAVEDCLHRWAYTMAASRDDAGLVSDAVAAACRAPLARWNQQSMARAADGSTPQDAPSLITGQATNPIAEHANFTSERALFYVVQARAGGCKPPPRKEGAAPLTAPDK